MTGLGRSPEWTARGGAGLELEPGVAEIAGCRRDRPASMISRGSIPCRYVLRHEAPCEK